MPKEDGLFGVLVMLPLVLILVSLVVLWACQNRIRTIRGLDSSRVRFVGAAMRRGGGAKRFFPLSGRS